MKKITILLAATLIVNIKSIGQLKKNTWLVGGIASYSSTKYKSDIGQKTTFFVFQMSPNCGYFIANKFVAGLKININCQGGKATGTTIFSTNTDYNFGPFVRYYLLSGEKQFNILTEATYQYGFIGGGQQNNKTSKNTIGISAGPVIYFNSSVGLEFLIGYSSYKYVGFAGSNNAIQFGLGFQIHLEKNE